MTRKRLCYPLLLAALASCGSDPGYDPVTARQSMDAMRQYITSEIADLDRRDPLLHLVTAYEKELLAMNRAIESALHAFAVLNADPAATRKQFSALFEATLTERDAHMGALLDALQGIRNQTNDREWAGIAKFEIAAYEANLDGELPYFRERKTEKKS